MILITGASGQLAAAISKQLDNLKIEYKGVSRDYDLTTDKLHDYILELKPSMVIHTGAYTYVDKAEEEPSLCEEINSGGRKRIALACKEVGAKMTYISTDYVFSGEGNGVVDKLGFYEKIAFLGSKKMINSFLFFNKLCQRLVCQQLRN